MTQKSNLFKGQQKKKSIPPNRHGKTAHIRKGKRLVKPSKVTKDMDANRDVKDEYIDMTVLLPDGDILEITKFINKANEMKAAAVANKEGGQLSIVKENSKSNNTKE